jgi:hypothetical protein
MSISLVNRYYLQKLVRQKMALTIKIQGSNISLNLTQVSPNLNLNDLGTREKYIQLELLISMHQKLAANRNISPEKLLEIENKILTILDIKIDGFSYLSLLNRLSDLAKKYLGTNMVVKYWKCSQSAIGLDLFEVSNSGELMLRDSTSTNLNQEQQEKIQRWIEKFIANCSIIIRDFEQTILAETLKK